MPLKTTGTRRTRSQYDFAKQLFDEMILPTTGFYRRATVPRRKKVQFVVNHHMTILDSDNGRANERCVETWFYRKASSHYGVDNDHVAQFVYDDCEAWGNGNSWANQRAIVVENANSKLGPTWEISDETIATNIKLVAALHVTHKLGRPWSKNAFTKNESGTVRTHRSFTSTECPGPYFKKIWDSYMLRLQAEYDRITGDAPDPTPNPPKVEGDTYKVVSGDTLYSIARRAKLEMSYLAKINNLASPYHILPGQVLQLKASEPEETPAEDLGYIVESYSQNLAGYDVRYGLETAQSRAENQIPAYLDNHSPDWFHFQELSSPMLSAMNAYMEKRGYARVSHGGKGRQSYYNTSRGITVRAADLKNVKHMLLKDTKEFLVIVAEYPGGYRDVQINFHNENEGSTYQPLQLKDVMDEALAVCDRHDVPLKNLLLSGDSNLKNAPTWVKFRKGWTTATSSAEKKIDLHIKTTNNWKNTIVKGDPIDINVTRTDATILESENHFGSVISDHWGNRTKRKLFLK